MNLGLEKKVVLIVGASRGIGGAAARAFAEEHASLALLSRGRDDLDRLVSELRDAHPAVDVVSFSRDATDPACAEEVVREAVARFGRVDVLVNNAGAGLRRAFEQLSDADWASSLELNLMAAIRFARAVLPDMKKRGKGRIINLGAVSATRPRRGQIASNVAKAGLVNFTRSLALEAAPYNILVNAVCPGTVDSPRWRAKFDALVREMKRPAEEVMLTTVGRAVPLGRVGTPEEVAGLIVFLAGAQSSYITGACIDVDGGLAAGILLE
jgi:NAD(P)-dependent dehydrogenase (short-subunit alcohol dehydrogenase family)